MTPSDSKQARQSASALDLFEARLRDVLKSEMNDTGRFSILEDQTGISGTTWKNFWYGKQHATAPMIQAILSAWPQYSVWLATGLANLLPQVAPTDTFDDRIYFAEAIRENTLVRVVANVIGRKYIDVYAYAYESGPRIGSNPIVFSKMKRDSAYLQSRLSFPIVLDVAELGAEPPLPEMAMHTWLLFAMTRARHNKNISGETSLNNMSLSEFRELCSRFNLSVLGNPSKPEYPHVTGQLSLVTLPQSALTFSQFKTISGKRYEDFGKRPEALFDNGNS